MRVDASGCEFCLFWQELTLFWLPFVYEKTQNSAPAVKRSRTFTNVHERSRTFTNVHDRSQTFTNGQRFFRVKTFVDGVDGCLGLTVCHLTFDDVRCRTSLVSTVYNTTT